MTRPYAFWDTSVLVSLCVSQGRTAEALEFFNRYEIVVWWATPVEISSAVIRLFRSGEIGASVRDEAQSEAESLSRNWNVVSPSVSVLRRAQRLLQLYPLRSADALQLAAAFTWAEDFVQGRMFLTFDRRLHDAAKQAGFIVNQL